jgi:hypothetical protein
VLGAKVLCLVGASCGVPCRVLGLPLPSSRPAFVDDRKSRQDLFVQDAHVSARLLVTRANFCAQIRSNFVTRRLDFRA